jgi:deoxyribose-phosphate aldolase
MRTPEQLAQLIDHALLHPALSERDFDNGLALCRELSVWSVCVKPVDVRRAAIYLAGANTLVCSVVAFPQGNTPTETKLHETERAMAEGAREIDYVINVSAAVSGQFDAIHAEMLTLNHAVQSKGAKLKVIFENAYLDDATKVRLCQIAKQVGVAFVKTSTGFASGVAAEQPTGATVHDVQLMVTQVTPRCLVKASGGIRDLEAMERFLDAGAMRIGTSATRTIIEQAKKR